MIYLKLSNKTKRHHDVCFPFSAFFKVFLECIEFIEWTDEIGPYRYDNYLCFSWQVDSRAPSSFHVLSVRNDCNELRLCWIMTDKDNQYWGWVGKNRKEWIFIYILGDDPFISGYVNKWQSFEDSLHLWIPGVCVLGCRACWLCLLLRQHAAASLCASVMRPRRSHLSCHLIALHQAPV